jgi:hypothetical protein
VLNDDGSPATFAPVPCLGKADNQLAANAGNPTRDPSRKCGDTPLGEFTGSLRYEPNTAANQHSFGTPDSTGAIPVIHLAPLMGDSEAWDRQTSEGVGNDLGLLIHCRVNENQHLYPTAGCVRTFQKDHTALLAVVGPHFPVDVTIEEIIPT